MTKNNISCLSAIVALLFLTFSMGCKKDDSNDLSNNPTNNQRIRQTIDYVSSTELGKTAFIYYGEKLIKISDSSKNDKGNWREWRKEEIAYNGNNVTNIRSIYSLNSNSWILESKSDYIINNEKVVEEIIHDEQWDEDHRRTYQYNGNALITWQLYEVYNDDFYELFRGEYVYDINGLKGYEAYLKQDDNWDQVDTMTFTHSDGRLMGWIDYSQSSGLMTSKCDYMYDGDRIIKAKFFNWDSETSSWEADYVISYAYDDHGYLIEEGSGNIKIVYEYEEGIGNARTLTYYPFELIIGTPTLKSTPF